MPPPDEADDVADRLLQNDAELPRSQDVGRADMPDEAGRADRRVAGEG